MRTLIAILVLLAALALVPSAHAQLPSYCTPSNTYYISFALGSDSNTQTQAKSSSTPWAHLPYMNNFTGHYVHTAGDCFALRGGDTWTAASYPITLPVGASGNASTPDYYGVVPTFHSGGSFTQPIFDAQQTHIGHFFLLDNVNYITIDNIEMKNQEVGFGFLTDGAIRACPSGAPCGAPLGITIENVYIHDFMTTGQLSSSNGVPWYSAGGIEGYVTVLHTTIDDTNGFGFNSNGVKVTGGWMGGGVWNGKEVSNSKFVHTMAACFNVPLCHDSEFTGGSQNAFDLAVASGGYAPLGGNRPHTQAIEDENGTGGFTIYNNWVHDNPNLGINLFVGYKGSQVYNNVLANNVGANKNLQMVSTGSDIASSAGVIYNNTIDCAGSGTAAIGIDNYKSASIAGTIDVKNTIYINCPAPITVGVTGSVTQSNNYPMSSSEATAFGFIAANKYSPTTLDSNVAATGANLTSHCSGALAFLCSDTSGAAWFGGSPTPRPSGATGWGDGAFQGQGGPLGPPAVTVTAPTNGNTVSGSSVTLTATCVPQGSATISSIQFFIDGSSFSSVGSSSPYNRSWDSTTATNADHTIGASCTDSNGQSQSASVVTVHVSNLAPGCFVSGASWMTFQSIGTQTGTISVTMDATPNTADQDTVIGFSQNPATAYGDMAAIIRFNSSGFIDVYAGTLGNYSASNSAPYSAGVKYSFAWTINLGTGTYTVSETAPSSIVLATGPAYTFRSGALTSNLSYINAQGDNASPDTVQVCNVVIGTSTSLTFTPPSLSFGSISDGTNATSSVSVSTSGGATTFSNVAVSGDASFTLNSNDCAGSVSVSCAPSVKFAPTSPGLKNGIIAFTDSATGNPQIYNLTGTGVAVAPSLSLSQSTLAFGPKKIGTTTATGPIIVTITNGPSTFPFPGVTYLGTNAADFSSASNSCANTVSTPSCQIVVNFTPSIIGDETATMRVTSSDASNSPQDVALTGTGTVSVTNAPSPKMFVWTQPLQIPIVLDGTGFPNSVYFSEQCFCDMSQSLPICGCGLN